MTLFAKAALFSASGFALNFLATEGNPIQALIRWILCHFFCICVAP